MNTDPDYEPEEDLSPDDFPSHSHWLDYQRDQRRGRVEAAAEYTRDEMYPEEPDL